MRKSISTSDALFSKTRQGVLGSLFLHPDEWRYLSDIAHELSVSPSSLQREIHSLVESELLESKRIGNRLYFRPNKDSILFSELQSIVVKTFGLTDVVRKSLKPFSSKIDVAFIFGSVARGDVRESSDIDVLIIGSVPLIDLALPFRKAQDVLKRTISPVLMTAAEARKMLGSDNHFLSTISAAPKIFLINNAPDLVRLIESRSPQVPSDK